MTMGASHGGVNIAASVEDRARDRPADPAIVCDGETLSYAELDDLASRAAVVLRDHGIGPADRVALQLPNVSAFVWSYLGTLKLGAIAVSLNPGLTSEETVRLLCDCGASVLVTTEALASSLSVGRAAAADLRHVFVVDDGGALAEMLRAAHGGVRAVRQAPDTPAVIVYTSGTTGEPRGATLSHGNVLFTMESKRRYLGVNRTDRLLLFLPLFHCFGQNAVLNAGLHAGATVVLQPGFDAARVLGALTRDEVTMLFGVPTNYVVLSALASRADLGSLRYCFSAAATLPREVEARWLRQFGLPIHQGYGATETSPFASYNHISDHRPGSVGVPIEGVDMRVIDHRDGRPLPPGAIGEIVVRGPNVMLGYWNRPRETAEVVRDGWFHTGDLGRTGEDGYFYIEDRLKDLVIVGGFNVYPAEVENVLYQHDAIHEAAVHGVPDPVLGERLRAVVVLRSGRTMSPDDVIAWCRGRLAAVKVPAEIAFATSLPRSRTGKILKRVLRDEYRPPACVARALGGVDDLVGRMARWLAGQLGTDAAAIDPDAAFADYGVTSIIAVELTLQVGDWTGRQLSPTMSWNCPTVRSLAAAALAPPLAAADA